MNKIITDKIEKYRICVVIPTYNNAKTLSKVLDGVLQFTPHILIINDGSTDETSSILSHYQNIKVIKLNKNKGKGNALKVGFDEALRLKYDYALTIDSDGQHYPDDIPVFINELDKKNQPILLVGSRNMEQENVPKKSSFGHRFSNFWFHLETGVKLTDTQSGYRLYPLKHLPKKYFSGKFEFEIEVLVRASWRGILLKNIPIKVLYDPKERVSHFRPIRDFVRISILNAILVLIALLYIKPRNFFRNLKKKSLKRFIQEDLLESNASSEVKALSVMLGVFCGIAPFWGFQTLIVISAAVFLKLNKSLAFLCSNVSIPPMIPLIVLGSLKIGSIFVGGEVLPEKSEITTDFIKNNLIQYLIGSIVLALVSALILGSLTYIFLKLKSKKQDI